MFPLLKILLFLILTSNLAHAVGINSQYNSKAKLSAIKDSCNGDSVSYIIKQHPELLKHKRDLTLRQGVRTSKYSLSGCINCHANKTKSGQYQPIDEDKQFCSSCHKKVAVSIDCFSCHSNINKDYKDE